MPHHVLITGGAGFIGSNLADRLLASGERVVVFDSYSRQGVEGNARWLRERHGSLVTTVEADIRDRAALRQAVRGASMVFHLAAQAAVAASVHDPIDDFEVNARGTLNLLEEVRRQPEPPPLLFTSTSKVYGAFPDVEMRTCGRSYEPADPVLRTWGIDEGRSLDLHSPYGCSKGAADQYLLDYARTYGLRTCVFRLSSIYGPRQCGTEDQGWIAHLLLRALEGREVTIHGDGLQVRDVLHVEDLLDAFQLARARMCELSGRAFNIGGGPGNALSVIECLDLIGALAGRPAAIRLSGWRTGDQRWYISNTGAFSGATGWKPGISAAEGIGRLHHWFVQQRGRSRRAFASTEPS